MLGFYHEEEYLIALYIKYIVKLKAMFSKMISVYIFKEILHSGEYIKKHVEIKSKIKFLGIVQKNVSNVFIYHRKSFFLTF